MFDPCGSELSINKILQMFDPCGVAAFEANANLQICDPGS